MPNSKPETKRVSLIIRLEPSLLAAVDQARKDTPRSVYIRTALMNETDRSLATAIEAVARPEYADQISAIQTPHYTLSPTRVMDKLTPGENRIVMEPKPDPKARTAPDIIEEAVARISVPLGPPKSVPGSRLRQPKPRKG